MMKAKKHAKDLREEATEQRKKQWRPEKNSAEKKEAAAAPSVPKKPAAGALPRTGIQTPEEETREFLAYLEKDRLRIRKEEEVSSRGRGKPRYAAVRTLNLENGMPTVEEALNQLRAELQRLKREGAKAVKLIHGYGSTGTGGKICIGVRRELAQMQRRQAISLFVAGEDFGPFHEDARKMADRIREITRDPDYGKCNHGITMVLL